MKKRRHFIIRMFLVSSGIVLFVLGVAKLVIGFGPMNNLWVLDPIFGVKLRFLMQVAGVLEIACGLMCLILSSAKQEKALLLLAWLATSLAAYRYGLWLMDWKHPCNCMGYLTKALHLSPAAADDIAMIILACLLVGSYACLHWLWRTGRKCTGST